MGLLTPPSPGIFLIFDHGFCGFSGRFLGTFFLGGPLQKLVDSINSILIELIEVENK